MTHVEMLFAYINDVSKDLIWTCTILHVLSYITVLGTRCEKNAMLYVDVAVARERERERESTDVFCLRPNDSINCQSHCRLSRRTDDVFL